MAYHCTKCGKTYGFFGVPHGRPTSGKRKGKSTPMCCGKELRKISDDVKKQIENERCKLEN